MREIKDQEVAEAYRKCDEVIAKFKAGQLETMPGCNEEQTMEVRHWLMRISFVVYNHYVSVYRFRHLVRCAW